MRILKAFRSRIATTDFVANGFNRWKIKRKITFQYWFMKQIFDFFSKKYYIFFISNYKYFIFLTIKISIFYFKKQLVEMKI